LPSDLRWTGGEFVHIIVPTIAVIPAAEPGPGRKTQPNRCPSAFATGSCAVTGNRWFFLPAAQKWACLTADAKQGTLGVWFQIF